MTTVVLQGRGGCEKEEFLFPGRDFDERNEPGTGTESIHGYTYRSDEIDSSVGGVWRSYPNRCRGPRTESKE